ncbi:putative asparagine synthase [Marasmius fiardii PR-910]|nr:putative asparagine synthase [Marasmius fiardii PR-910]
MCGISGIYSRHHAFPSGDSAAYGANLESNLRTSIEAMANRGPDSSGTFHEVCEGRSVGLAHARLSIIDLEGGHQPLHDDENYVHAVVNGEFYDYATIRKRLEEEEDCVFKNLVDSELLIHLYKVYGLDSLLHLRGEFAFILYDQKRGLLFAARDRFGIKPLYYTLLDGGNKLLLASEMKALVPLGWKPEWDVESIVQMGEFSDDRTVFKGVYKLPPAHQLIFRRSGQLKIEPYWDHTYTPQDVPERRSLEVMINGIQKRLIESVKARLRSDVPLGVYLSGGIDSAVVAGIAAKLLKEDDPNARLTSFTLAFPGRAELDEGPIAKRMAEFIGAELHLVTPTEADLVSYFEKSVYHSEQPVHNLNGAGKIILSEYVQRHSFKVILTGEGSDEVFGGYSFFLPDYLRAVDNASTALGIPLPTSSELSATLKDFEGKKIPEDHLSISQGAAQQETGTRTLGGIYFPKVFRIMGLDNQAFSQDVLDRVGYPGNSAHVAERLNAMGRTSIVSQKYHPLHSALYTGMHTTLPNYILNILGDRMEMANSIEGRPPFLDHHLVEYANSLPPSVKIMPRLMNDEESVLNQQKWAFTEKWILRQAARPFVTDEIFNRAKAQYNAPLPRHSSTSISCQSAPELTPLQSYLKTRLTEGVVNRLGWARWEYFDKLLEDYLQSPQSPADGGIDRRARILLCIASFVVLQERFGVPPANWEKL